MYLYDQHGRDRGSRFFSSKVEPLELWDQRVWAKIDHHKFRCEHQSASLFRQLVKSEAEEERRAENFGETFLWNQLQSSQVE